ncbi:HNH endonuclease [Bacillus cereus]|uniref:HNH endonuclease n=1 Tax=Bacillus cereus TaxID=1396 RepID=UPI0020D26ADB|nr:HNH endonuclease [Bacillus cereus]
MVQIYKDKSIRASSHYECQECKRRGKYSKGRNVHHIKQLRNRPDLVYNLSNLEKLCIT